MRTVWVLGAGASRGYYKSRTLVHPPLASDYFSTFQKLLISGDLEVKVGFIVNYLRDTRGISPERLVAEFDENVESVFAELDSKLRASFDLSTRDHQNVLDTFNYTKAYDQFVFWFSHVLNEIQNGEPCPIYSRLISNSKPGDTFLTFNWDTLLDRALDASGLWHPDDGYGVSFHGVLDGRWRDPAATRSRFRLLKLHGSTNWFAPYVTRNLQTGERQWAAIPTTAYKTWCLRDGSCWFPTYKDRWRPGYDLYSYFFAPNDPIADLPLMPIIIPPTEVKLFHEHTHVLEAVWSAAEEAVRSARRLILAGYSFPRTDVHAYSLLGEFLSEKSSEKRIEIVDPFPAAIAERVREYVDSRCDVRIAESTLAAYLGEKETILGGDEAHPDSLALASLLGGEDERERRNHLLKMLVLGNLHNHRFDVTTYDRRRFLGVTIEGEFATHMVGAYRPEVLDYRLANIRFRLETNGLQKLALDEIWIVHALKREPITQEELDAADVGSMAPELREMIRKGYHCRDDAEEDYFCRRFLAS